LDPIEGKRKKYERGEQEENDIDQRDDLDARLLAGTELNAGAFHEESWFASLSAICITMNRRVS
jgi:hypothetical protein